MIKININKIVAILVACTVGVAIYTDINRPMPVKNINCTIEAIPPKVNTEGLVEFEMLNDTIKQSEENKEPDTASITNEAEENVATYTEDDLYWLSKAIAQELGSNWVPDWAQQWVASVVLNRVNHPSFPDTIYGVLHQPGQYCGFYATPTEQNIANARYVLENGSVLPENVVFQSLCTQGSGIHGAYYDPYMNNTTYFCYQ